MLSVGFGTRVLKLRMDRWTTRQEKRMRRAVTSTLPPLSA